MEDKQNSLYIPANIKTRLEFFKGYGIKELVITISVMTFFMPLIFCIYKFRNTITAVIVFLVLVAGTVISTVKDDNNLCIMEQIKYMINKLRMQKKFEYKFYDKRRNVK